MAATKKEKPNDFGKLYDACTAADLECQLHVYGSGKKAGLQIEIYKDDDCIETEQVGDKKPEAAAKILHARMKKAGQIA
jgi:hypothetical protein